SFWNSGIAMVCMAGGSPAITRPATWYPQPDSNANDTAKIGRITLRSIECATSLGGLPQCRLQDCFSDQHTVQSGQSDIVHCSPNPVTRFHCWILFDNAKQDLIRTGYADRRRLVLKVAHNTEGRVI